MNNTGGILGPKSKQSYRCNAQTRLHISTVPHWVKIGSVAYVTHPSPAKIMRFLSVYNSKFLNRTFSMKRSLKCLIIKH